MIYRVIHKCSKCNHIEHEKVSRKRQFFERLSLIGVFFGMFLVFVGALTTLRFFEVVDAGYIGELIGGGYYATTVDMSNSLISKKDMQILKAYANGITSNCLQNDTDCKITAIYTNLKYNWEYEIGYDLNPLNILDEKEGDCDEVNNLFVTLLDSIGIEAYLECDKTHCRTLIHLGNETKFLDVTPRER